MTRILVVADRKDFRSTVSDALQKHGFQLFEASDGQKAISSFTKDVPEIVVLDYDSLGKKCLEMVTFILSMRSSTRIILLAAPITDLDDMELIGVDILLIKPFPLERLLKGAKALSKMKPPMKIVAR